MQDAKHVSEVSSKPQREAAAAQPFSWLIVLCLVGAFLGFCGDPSAVHAQTVASAVPPTAHPSAFAEYDRPPGSAPDDGGPSEVIFPPQTLTIRFNHAKHVKQLKMSC